MRIILIIWPLIMCLSACAVPAWKQAPHDAIYQKVPPVKLHPPVEEREPSEWWDHFWESTFRPLGEFISPATYARLLIGGTPALDINAFGQVPDSPWFTNRINRNKITPEQMRRGPDTLSSPPSDGPLEVFAAKSQGVTPGLFARDKNGNAWVIKFDPPAFPEMASGAEVLATKLFHAAGYFVPENYVASFKISRLKLAAKASTRDHYNRKIAFKQHDLDELIAKLNPQPDGTTRALWSRLLPGRPVGPFPMENLRYDDPNDHIPHQHLRSLRGLWVFAAWLNHVDIRHINTLDAFVPDEKNPKVGHVRHYLIDFGTTLGSGGSHPKATKVGYEYRIDWPIIGVRLATLGGYYPYWVAVEKSPFRSIGVFESDVFDPKRWHPTSPNPAFDQATAHDMYWGASILARFTPELIAAAVSTAEFSEEGAADELVRILVERRDKILRYLFEPVLPLEDPRLEGEVLHLTDLAVASGVRARTQSYGWKVYWNHDEGIDTPLGAGTHEQPIVDLAGAIDATKSLDGFAEDPFVTVRLWQGDENDPGPLVEVHLRVVDGGARLILAGLDREAH